MDYESDRAIAEIKMEEAKRKAEEDASVYNLTGNVPDPNWAQPAETGNFAGVALDQAQGFWINKGKRGGNKDENISNAEFDHDLPTLLKNGPTDLPAVPAETAKISTTEIENRIKDLEASVTDLRVGNL